MSLDKFSILPHRPYRCIIMLVGAVVATFLIQHYIYKVTTPQSEQDSQQIKGEYRNLVAEYEILNEKFSHISESERTQKHELDIQTATVKTLEQELVALQTQATSLNKELMFYESLLQGERSKKIQIRDLLLRPSATDKDIIYYQLVITQGDKINKALEGSIEIMMNTSGAASITIAEHPLNLRHVQLIEGQIKLDNDIEPETVTITIKQKEKQLLSQSFDWQLSSQSEE